MLHRMHLVDVTLVFGDLDPVGCCSIEFISSSISDKIFRFSLNLFLFISFSDGCFVKTDALMKIIQDLVALVKQLRDDIAYQRGEISHLRTLIENCAGCKEPAPQNCHNANPCYSGVTCHDTPSGMRCGRCPTGMMKLNIFI